MKIEYHLNGESIDSVDLHQFLHSLFQERSLISNGGYLFKTAQNGQHLYIEILPSFLNGQREYHYNLKPPVTQPVLIGTITPNRSVTLIIKEKNWSTELQPLYRELILNTADIISIGAVSHQLSLDSVSCDVIESCFGKRPQEGPVDSLLTFF